MQFRTLTPEYAVAPQIVPEDVASIRDAGFRTVICNRPDGEIPPELSAAALRRAVEEAGLAFVELQVSHRDIGPQTVAAQAAAVAEAEGPVLAYCASGNRCTILWALSQAGHRPPEEILEIAARAGYDLSGIAPHLGEIFV